MVEPRPVPEDDRDAYGAVLEDAYRAESGPVPAWIGDGFEAISIATEGLGVDETALDRIRDRIAPREAFLREFL